MSQLILCITFVWYADIILGTITLSLQMVEAVAYFWC